MLKEVPYFCFTTVILMTFIDFTIQTDLYDGSICELHTGETGICKNAQSCKWLIQNLQKKKMKFSDIRRCFFSGQNEEVVCCGDEHPKQVNHRPEPCELGYLFDSFNCVPKETAVSNPTPTESVPVVTKKDRISGTKLSAACIRYAEMATPYIPSNIINGKPAGLTEFPHMAALGYSNAENGYDFDCGGSLIADRWIVTAAHCIKERRKPVIVRLGKVSLYSDEDGVDAIDRPISRTVRHPQYSFLRKKNDIALVEFEGSVEFNDIVRPACIRTDVSDLPETVELIIAGWGSIEAERINRSEILLKANVSSVQIDMCNRTLVDYSQGKNDPSLRGLSETQMCALNPIDNSDACQGDSGGPIFLYTQSGVSTVVGVVSFGVSCGLDLPGVYTRIASYMDWIEDIIWP